eukprot:CAMPEP_0174250196 /NCGR_PEP_ID=MMETSP0439-20130205/446_1 /TAXON_ID=0 /ORGANISM="Stereomyxa ramosa, Strain Chinc5" /LENGTH=108 /DNA_ID=CAMNT_0015330203 /DNA_START=12 /DNA_END=335 /DNA_ORIENTATION=-
MEEKSNESDRILKDIRNKYLICVDGSDYSLTAMKKVCEQFYEPKDVVIALSVGKNVTANLETSAAKQLKQSAKLDARFEPLKAYLEALPEVKVIWEKQYGDPREEILW